MRSEGIFSQVRRGQDPRSHDFLNLQQVGWIGSNGRDFVPICLRRVIFPIVLVYAQRVLGIDLGFLIAIEGPADSESMFALPPSAPMNPAGPTPRETMRSCLWPYKRACGYRR